ncbi:MAG: hypothetical protein JRF53_00445 [Deltaproteobacteria bacterium]|nr:hypothetical protein [Deltaproteobacteria bacterium]
MQRFANKTEIAFMQLAQLFDITIEKGWKTTLAEKIGIKRILISTWINRDRISKNGLKHIEKAYFSKDKWLTTVKPFPEAPYDTGLPGPDSRPHLYTLPTGQEFAVKAVIERDRPDSEYIDAVKEILSSGERATIEALKSNITQFFEQVRDKTRLKKLEKQVDQLTKQLNTEKNADDLLHEPENPAEGE